MKTNKILLLISSTILFPLFAIALNIGMNEGIVLFTIVTYTILMINTLTK